jgi:hypothetical protein
LPERKKISLQETGQGKAHRSRAVSAETARKIACLSASLVAPDPLGNAMQALTGNPGDAQRRIIIVCIIPPDQGG